MIFINDYTLEEVSVDERETLVPLTGSIVRIHGNEYQVNSIIYNYESQIDDLGYTVNSLYCSKIYVHITPHNN